MWQALVKSAPSHQPTAPIHLFENTPGEPSERAAGAAPPNNPYSAGGAAGGVKFARSSASNTAFSPLR